jgi:hypothetical protein
MYPGDEAVVVATVTVVFDAVDAGGAAPHEIAARLIADERVSTVRVGAFGAPSVYRVDVPAGDRDLWELRALSPAERVADELGVTIEASSVVEGAHNPDAVDRIPTSDGPAASDADRT